MSRMRIDIAHMAVEYKPPSFLLNLHMLVRAI